ncbi:4-amino-4-deoxychorismate lyase [Raineyella antarctica]|uniref:4-amino-4-deoxychorismate lyase n=1 Tax=Raineyella antarctica TaxID=1577474 RepID=A0A1G6HEM4_9ACTN|nr:aminodeoxychorismate lyase [Raineyella antarctica]SDB92710.1 4-amino-4-deoxychorismate lyase [Raineyella antarctica]
MNAQLVAVLGRGVVDPETPVLYADDAGLTRGDGCFDTCRVVHDGSSARALHLDEHLARFARSAELLDLPVPDLAAWRKLVATALAAWPEPGEASLKLILTRGPAHLSGAPTGLLLLTVVDGAAQERARSGLRVVTLDRGYRSDVFATAPWLLGGAKTLSYGVNVAAKREATARGADDVLFVSTDGYLLEGPTSGLLVAREQELVAVPTGATGVLESVTVATAMAAAWAAGWRTSEELLRPGDLSTCLGTWLVSTVRGVCPVLELDGAPVPQDAGLTARVTEWAGF